MRRAAAGVCALSHGAVLGSELSRMQRGGPPSHKEWTAWLHSGVVILPPEILFLVSDLCRDQSVRLNSGVAMSSVPMPKTKRKSRSY